MILKALSIQQPWADAILRLGKDVENRTWPLRYRGPILIHAGKRYDREGEEFLPTVAGIPFPNLESFLASARERCGGIVGMVEICDCRGYSRSPWFVGPYGFFLWRAQELPFTPCRGSLGLFNLEVPPALEEQVQRWLKRGEALNVA